MAPNTRSTRQPAARNVKSKGGTRSRGGANSKGKGKKGGRDAGEEAAAQSSQDTLPTLQSAFSFDYRLPTATPVTPGPGSEESSVPEDSPSRPPNPSKRNAAPPTAADTWGRDEGNDSDIDGVQSSGDHPEPPSHEESTLKRLDTISESSKHAPVHFGTISHSTPYNTRTGAATTRRQTAKQEGASLATLIGIVPTSEPGFIHSKSFARNINSGDIQTWLRSDASKNVYGMDFLEGKTSEFKKKHRRNGVWSLPEKAELESQLYKPFLKILVAICDHFVKPGLQGVEREVMPSDKVRLAHEGTRVRTSPDFVVRATGAGFEVPLDPKKPFGYSNIVTFFDAKTDNAWDDDHLPQLSSYSRQIFAQQPNRMFVRGLLISETRAKLIQFDRAGAQWSPEIELNRNPGAFVSLVIALCGGGSESQMGFDDSFHWEFVNGRKDTGYLKFGPEGKIYDLVPPRPISHSFDIRGNATTVWGVEERETKEKFTIKDSWTPTGRTTEYELLKILKDVKGIGEMLDFHIRDIKTSHFRCPSTVGTFRDRNAARVLTKHHGRGITGFSGVVELLYALMDVHVAVFETYSLNILHRNITDGTVFLGSPDAEVGMRGVLIGFESALNFHPWTGDKTVSSEPRIGTRFFQSCAILRSLTELSIGKAPPQDHMDEIESLFYLLCYLFFLFLPNGDPRSDRDRARTVVKGWDSDSPDEAMAFKSFFFNPALGQKEVAIEIVSDSWGPACGELFEKFLEWVWDIQQKKGEILRENRKKEREVERQERARQKKAQETVTNKGDEASRVKQKGGKFTVPIGEESKKLDRIDEEPRTTPAMLPHSAPTLGDQGPTIEEADSVPADPVDLVESGSPSREALEVTFKKGVFSSLMEGGKVIDHFTQVTKFFLTAIAKIQLRLEDGVPVVQISQPRKRKSEGTAGRTTKKLRRTPQ